VIKLFYFSISEGNQSNISGHLDRFRAFWIMPLIYLTFFSSAIGKFYPGMPEAEAVARLIMEKIPYLAAISAGSVLMGANTYIGNAPNFMVKSIIELYLFYPFFPFFRQAINPLAFPDRPITKIIR
jgi:Na+/H+ antiporter NhaD/arsenite permease-like protein